MGGNELQPLRRQEEEEEGRREGRREGEKEGGNRAGDTVLGCSGSAGAGPAAAARRPCMSMARWLWSPAGRRASAGLSSRRCWARARR